MCSASCTSRLYFHSFAAVIMKFRMRRNYKFAIHQEGGIFSLVLCGSELKILSNAHS